MPYTFGTATAAIPLSQLDTNFATPITLGNTSVYLNNTYSSIGNLTLANVTITSGTVAITNVSVTTANVSGTANVSTLVVTANASVAGNVAVTGNVVVTGNVTSATQILTGGTANGVVYLDTTKALTTGSALVFDGANLGVGVTPSAWATSGTILKALQIGAAGSVAAGTIDPSLQISQNAYFDGTSWNRISTGSSAGNYYISGNTHNWRIAASGANPISFTNAMTLDASGNLLVGTTSSSGTVVGSRFINGAETINCAVSASTNGGRTSYELYSTGAGAYRFYVGAGGTIFATSVVISAISDQRLKENVRDIDTGLHEVMALKPRRFDWKEGKGQDKKNVAGFIAQEFEDVFPECVSTSKAGADGIEYKNINHETLIPTLVKAIQELKAEFDAYKASHP